MRVSSNIYNYTNQSNCMHEEIKRRLHSGNVCCLPFGPELCVCYLRNIKINVNRYKNIVLPVAG